MRDRGIVEYSPVTPVKHGGLDTRTKKFKASLVLVWRNFTVRRRMKTRMMILVLQLFFWFFYTCASAASQNYATKIYTNDMLDMVSQYNNAASYINPDEYDGRAPMMRDFAADKLVVLAYEEDGIQNGQIDKEILDDAFMIFRGYIRSALRDEAPRVLTLHTDQNMAKLMANNRNIVAGLTVYSLSLDYQAVNYDIHPWLKDMPAKYDQYVENDINDCTLQHGERNFHNQELDHKYPSDKNNEQCLIMKYVDMNFLLFQTAMNDAVIRSLRIHLDKREGRTEELEQLRNNAPDWDELEALDYDSFERSLLSERIEQRKQSLHGDWPAQVRRFYIDPEEENVPSHTRRLELPGEVSIVSEMMPKARMTTSVFHRASKQLAFYMALAFFNFFAVVASEVMDENTDGHKEMLGTFGCGRFWYWLHWYIVSAVASLFLSILATFICAVFGVFGSYTHSVVVYFVFFNYLCGLCTQAFLISAIGPVKNMSGFIRDTFLILSYAIFWILDAYKDEIGDWKYLFCINTGTTFYLAVTELLKMRPNEGVSLMEIFNLTELAVQYIWIMFSMQFVNFFLAFYLDSVIPTRIGVSRPWHFLISDYFLGNKKDAAKCHDFDHLPSPSGQLVEEPSDNLKQCGLAIRCRGIRKEFANQYGAKTKALDGVDLDIYYGEIFALLGHNGAGKTTLINLLTCQLPVTDGDAVINGYSISKQSEKSRESISLAPQHNLFYNYNLVVEHLIVFASLRGVNVDEAMTDAEDVSGFHAKLKDILTFYLLEYYEANRRQEKYEWPSTNTWEGVVCLCHRLMLFDKLFTFTHALSGGMLRRLWLCFAMIGEPKVLYLDEPTSGVDPLARQILWKILTREKSPERSIIITTHHMEEADTLADRKAILREGRIFCLGTSVFLKDMIGAGYVLELQYQTQLSQVKRQKLISKVRTFAKGAQAVDTFNFSDDGAVKREELMQMARKNESDFTSEGYYNIDMTATKNRIFMMTIPHRDYEGITRILKWLEAKKDKNKNGSSFDFSLSINTLEDIFMALPNYSNVLNKSLNRALSRSLSSFKDMESTRGQFVLDKTLNSSFYKEFKTQESQLKTKAQSARQGPRVPYVEQKLPPIIVNTMIQIWAIITLRWFENTVSYFAWCLELLFPVLTIMALVYFKHAGGYLTNHFDGAQIAEFNYDNYEYFRTPIPTFLDIQSFQEHPAEWHSKVFPLLEHLPFNRHLIYEDERMFEVPHGEPIHAAKLLRTDIQGRKARWSFYIQSTTIENRRQEDLAPYTVAGLSIEETFRYKTEAGDHAGPGAVTFRIFFNPRSPHSVPKFINGISQSVLQTVLGTPRWLPGDELLVRPSESQQPMFKRKESFNRTVFFDSNEDFLSRFLTKIKEPLEPITGLNDNPKGLPRILSMRATPLIIPQPQMLSSHIFVMYIILNTATNGALSKNTMSMFSEKHSGTRHNLIVGGCRLLNYWIGTLIGQWIFLQIASLVFSMALAYNMHHLFGNMRAFSMLMIAFGFTNSCCQLYHHNMIYFMGDKLFILLMQIINATISLSSNHLFAGFFDNYRPIAIYIHWTFCLLLAPYVHLSAILSVISMRNMELHDQRSLTIQEILNPFGLYLPILVGSVFQSIVYWTIIYYTDVKAVVKKNLGVAQWYRTHLFELEAQRMIAYGAGNPHMISPELRDWRDDDVYEEEKIAKGISVSLAEQEFAKKLGEPLPKIEDNTNIPLDIMPYTLPILLCSGIGHAYMPMTAADSPLVSLQNVNLVVPKGEVLGLLGHNGAGKTTLIKLISTNDTVGSSAAGEIRVGGHSVENDKMEALSLMSICPQFDSMFEYVTVYRNLKVYGLVRGLTGKELKDSINSLLKELDLEEHKHKAVYQLSGGNKRRVSLACSFLGKPKLVLLDEPSAGVDPEGKRAMRDLILSRSADKATVITTHSIDEAEVFCSRITIMVNGVMHCLNSTMVIKKRYGAGFRVYVKIDLENEDIKNNIQALRDIHLSRRAVDFCEEFKTKFRASLSDVNGDCFWFILKSDTKLSEAFDFLNEKMNTDHVLDYNIAQPSLEQVFIRFARRQGINVNEH